MTFPPSEREAAAITVAKMISYRNDLPVAVQHWIPDCCCAEVL